MIPFILVLMVPQTLKGTNQGLANPTDTMPVEDFLPMLSEVTLHFQGTWSCFYLINLAQKMTFLMKCKSVIAEPKKIIIIVKSEQK